MRHITWTQVLRSNGQQRKSTAMFGLTEVHAEGLLPLKEALKKQLPESLVAHGYIDFNIRCNFDSPESKVLVASDFPIKSFLAITPTVTWDGVESLFLYYLEEESTYASDNELASLLRSLPDLDWSRPVFLFGSPIHVIVRVINLLNRGLLSTNQQYHSLFSFRGHSLLFQAKEPSPDDIKIPEGFTLNSLYPEDMDVVFPLWNFNFTDSIINYQELVTKLPSSVVFKTASEGEKSQLVAWVLTYKYGAIGNTYTQPMYRHRGLATAVTLDLTRKILSLGSPSYVVVEDSNKASIAFHGKMGFRRAYPTGFELVAPTHVSAASLGAFRLQGH
ncbi:uncharacterized protein LOC143040050 isoform X2 [Oratosquilla oratoria]|uniref:uncharacterized protein LOC143040050 isoform X2 n=1 Tax=Oratosquilla oratoria TaxID=337810 RepID=UPI003F75AECD